MGVSNWDYFEPGRFVYVLRFERNVAFFTFGFLIWVYNWDYSESGFRVVFQLGFLIGLF